MATPDMDIVILSLTRDEESFRMTEECIRSLIDSEENIRFRILLIESNAEYEKMGFSYPEEVEVIIPDRPFNFNAFNNIGLKASGSPWIAFCNNDLLFEKGWASAILNAAKEAPGIRSFCPYDPENPHTPPGRFDESRPFIEGYRIREEFVGWCFVVKRSLFGEIGPFDERFDFYYADDDYVMELRSRGLKHAVVPASRVHHLAHRTSTTGKVNINLKMEEDRKKYHGKWGSQRAIAWKHRMAVVLRPIGLARLLYGRKS